MCYIYTMEYYSAIKNNQFTKILGKCSELENTILSEVTQPKKHTWNAVTDKLILAQNLWIPMVQFTYQMIPTENVEEGPCPGNA